MVEQLQLLDCINGVVPYSMSATHYNTLQHTATRCNALQLTATPFFLSF